MGHGNLCDVFSCLRELLFYGIKLKIEAVFSIVPTVVSVKVNIRSHLAKSHLIAAVKLIHQCAADK